MRAAQLQTLLSVQANVISGLHEEYAKLKAERKRWNALADAEDDPEKKDDFAGHAALYTPYIRKFKKKIAAVEKVQKALKKELKREQAIEIWQAAEDAEWLQLAQLAQRDDYRVTYSYDQLAEMFKDPEE
jgi:superfamily II RNA helicase